jgi:hypothetical protein
MQEGVKIDPESFYDGDLLFSLLDFSRSTLAVARRSGRLRFIRRGNRILYRGQWILDWLAAPAIAQPEGSPNA